MVATEKQLGANTLEVTRQVEKAIEQLRPGLTGLQLDTTIFRPATFIEMSLRNLRISLMGQSEGRCVGHDRAGKREPETGASVPGRHENRYRNIRCEPRSEWTVDN